MQKPDYEADKRRAAEVESALSELQSAIGRAAMDGLHVEVETMPIQDVDGWGHPYIGVKVSRVLT